ncbi:MAG TPA: hypothetical protein VLH56_04180, partial [Dissulfurispiraceae bacterium]|nr:hypothetical protein [Dissulfurispiraceae bacterium]
ILTENSDRLNHRIYYRLDLERVDEIWDEFTGWYRRERGKLERRRELTKSGVKKMDFPPDVAAGEISDFWKFYNSLKNNQTGKPRSGNRKTTFVYIQR